jgi:hypothetical protein
VELGLGYANGGELARESLPGHLRRGPLLRRLIPLASFLRFERRWARQTGQIFYAADSVITLRVVRHHGAPLQLGDGTAVRAGDCLGELHFDSFKLLDCHHHPATLQRTGFRFVRGVSQALSRLADYLARHPEHRLVAIYGKTLYWRVRRHGALPVSTGS